MPSFSPVGEERKKIVRGRTEREHANRGVLARQGGRQASHATNAKTGERALINLGHNFGTRWRRVRLYSAPLQCEAVALGIVNGL